MRWFALGAVFVASLVVFLVALMPAVLVIDKVPSGYLVASLGDSERVVSILQAAGDADYQLLKRGPYVGRVSLGVFSIRANAERRADGVAKRGIDAELIVRASQVAIDRRAATRTLARAE